MNYTEICEFPYTGFWLTLKEQTDLCFAVVYFSKLTFSEVKFCMLSTILSGLKQFEDEMLLATTGFWAEGTIVDLQDDIWF